MGARTFPVLDSTPADDALVAASWRSLSPRERLDHVVALNELCEQLSRAGVRARYPSADEDEVRLRVLALRLGRELMVEVYGWDPLARGW